MVRELEIIGEASNKISMDLRQNHPEIAWLQIIDLRNRITHGYFSLNNQIIWEIVKEDLAPLKQNVEHILEEVRI